MLLGAFARKSSTEAKSILRNYFKRYTILGMPFENFSGKYFTYFIM